MSLQARPVVCTEILGHETDAQYTGRRVDVAPVASADASKRRQRLTSEAGIDVAVDLERGSFLRDGAVLADDGERVVVVRRTPEEVMRITVSPALDTGARIAAALRIGHAFGNHHVPAEVVGDELVVPITTSRAVALRTLDSLQLEGVEAQFEVRPIALERPLAGHAHAH